MIRTQFLIPKKKDKIYIYSTILGAILNVTINLILIPRLGAIGAVIGTIFAEGIVAIYQTIMVRKELDIKLYISKTIFYIIPGIIMCTIIRFMGNIFRHSIITGLIQIIAGMIIYIGITLIYMFIIKDEMIMPIIRKFDKWVCNRIA